MKNSSSNSLVGEGNETNLLVYLPFIPLVFHGIFGTLEMIKLIMINRSSDEKAILEKKKRPWLYKTRMILTIFAALMVLAEFIVQDMSTSRYNAIFYIILVITLMINLYWRNLAREIPGSNGSTWVQFIFWLLLTLCWLHSLHDALNILNMEPKERVIRHIPLILQLILFIIILILETMADVDENVDDNSEESASFISKATLSWMDSLVIRGKDLSRPLQVEDLPIMRKRVQLETILEKQNLHNRQNEKKERKERSINILPHLLRSFAPTIFCGMAVKAAADGLNFAMTQVLRMFIRSISTRKDNINLHPGYLWGIALFLTAILQATFNLQNYVQAITAGFQMRSAAISAIYRKSLTLKASERSKYTTGEITNLMALDSQRFVDVASNVNFLWSIPIQFTGYHISTVPTSGSQCLCRISYNGLVHSSPMLSLLNMHKGFKDIKIRPKIKG